MRDITAELKQLRLYGMAGAWLDLIEQGASTGSADRYRSYCRYRQCRR